MLTCWCLELGMLRPTRSWTSRAKAVAANEKSLKHWIFWNLVLRKGLPHTVAAVIVKLAVPDGSRHVPFELFQGEGSDHDSIEVQSRGQGTMASDAPICPKCIPAVHPAAAKVNVGLMQTNFGLHLLPELWVGHPEWYDDKTTMDEDVLARLNPLQGHEQLGNLLQFTRTVANGRVFIGGEEAKDWDLTGAAGVCTREAWIRADAELSKDDKARAMTSTSGRRVCSGRGGGRGSTSFRKQQQTARRGAALPKGPAKQQKLNDENVTDPYDEQLHLAMAISKSLTEAPHANPDAAAPTAVGPIVQAVAVVLGDGTV